MKATADHGQCLLQHRLRSREVTGHPRRGRCKQFGQLFGAGEKVRFQLRGLIVDAGRNVFTGSSIGWSRFFSVIGWILAGVAIACRTRSGGGSSGALVNANHDSRPVFACAACVRLPGGVDSLRSGSVFFLRSGGGLILSFSSVVSVGLFSAGDFADGFGVSDLQMPGVALCVGVDAVLHR